MTRPKDSEPSREQRNLRPYVKAATYQLERDAVDTYIRVQFDLFNEAGHNLGVRRLRFASKHHVVVLGSIPTPELNEKIIQHLSSGTPTILPKDIETYLFGLERQNQRMLSTESDRPPSLIQ